MSAEPLHREEPPPDSRLRAAQGAPDGFLIQRREDDCRQCRGCVRVCPARAIGVSDGGTLVIQERCVACGACVIECGTKGHVVRDDTPVVRALLGSGRPVVAVLATESVAALHPMTPAEIERSLEALSFHAVESTLLGEEMVGAEFERFLAARGCLPTLRSTCPVVVSWVLRFHPKLSEALVPLVPPYVAQARLVKALYPEGTAVVYVSPCFARKDDCSDPQFEGAVDVAIDFVELTRLLQDAPPPPPGSAPTGSRRPAPIKEVSLTDGFPRTAATANGASDEEVAVVRGLRPLDSLLAAITAGEAAPALVDMLSCDGCLDGPAVAPELSVYAKRSIAVAERDRAQGAGSVGCRRLLVHLPKLELRRSFKVAPVVVSVPSAATIDRILAEGGIFSREDALDCGACGHPTCVEQAVAIAQGYSTWEMCWPLQARRLEESLAALEEAATTDTLTGLANRRQFEIRLAEEADRVSRYGGELAVLMIDIDFFKAVNDRYGHQSGDSVLRAVGAILPRVLRGTDLSARYGGDEFGVVLPGIGKTAAFAVAEKVRLAARAICVAGEGTEAASAVTLSIGVAACPNPPCDVTALIEAADRALYRAKETGRDRVELAPD